jgi:4-amino-4-deoxy-L-arabinose transferase-like glycosyltransferase
MKLAIKFFFNLPVLMILSVIMRFIATYFYGDDVLEYEWLTLLRNLNNYGIISLEKFIPSVFMPPLYLFVLYVLQFITPENFELVKVVLIFQVFLSTITIFVFYNLNKFFFSKNWSLFNSFLLSIFPLNIYTATQISSISLQIFLLTLYLYLFFSLQKKEKTLNFDIVSFSIVSGALMLLRGEFYLIFLISLIYLFIFKKINIKIFLFIFLISIITISPYLVRNYIVFDKVLMTKSLGFNLWKGNNPFATVEGSLSGEAHEHDKIFEEIDKIPKNFKFEIERDNLFLEKGLKHIKDKPLTFIAMSIKRFLSLFYFNLDSSYPNYYHPLFIIPIILIGIFSTLGIISSFKNLNIEKGYLFLHLFLTISIFSLFFILPRYKMIILPIQFIFMNYFFLEFYEKNKYINKIFKEKL